MSFRDYFQEALQSFNGGNWYNWKKYDDDGNRIPDSERMQYKWIKIVKDVKDAETAKVNSKTSAIAKLKKLGLTDDEIKALRL